jgi:8-oxo-dGTP diphosphatase
VSHAAPSRRIRVVAAILERSGSLLVCRRRDRPGKPGLWEFPGGKIEPGESEAEALRRELKEELAVDATVGGLYCKIEHPYPELVVELTFLHATFPDAQTPKALAAAELRWVPQGDLPKLPFLEADRPLVERLASEALTSKK